MKKKIIKGSVAISAFIVLTIGVAPIGLNASEKIYPTYSDVSNNNYSGVKGTHEWSGHTPTVKITGLGDCAGESSGPFYHSDKVNTDYLTCYKSNANGYKPSNVIAAGEK